MRWLSIVLVALSLGAAGVASAEDGGPYGITGFLLPPGGSVAAAAWRRGGGQVVVVAPDNSLLFWDTASGRLIDALAIDGFPPPSADPQAPRRVTLRLSPDGRTAAVTVQPSDRPLATVLLDLAARKETAILDRPALFWTAGGLVVGPRAACTAACDFAVVDPRGAQATPVGTGFGDGRLVALSADGSRFASIVAEGTGQALAIWSVATWAAVARTPLAAGEVLEVGFDRAGARAFARLDGPRVTVLDLATGMAATTPLPPQTAGQSWATDLDARSVMTATGPVPFDSRLYIARRGLIGFYATDPRYGAIYAYDDGMSPVINGTLAAVNEFPWQVELQYRAPPGSTFSPLVLHNCGGSLIRPGWVVTATHCFLTADNVLRSDAEVKAHTVVRAGSTELDHWMTEFDVVAVYIRRCGGGERDDCFHDYDPNAKPPTPPTNDITLLHVVPHPYPPATPAAWPLRDKRIRPIRLPRAGTDVRPPLAVTMTGWGATSAANAQHQIMSGSLNRADLAVMPRGACSSDHGFGALPASVICAGSTDGAQLACKGDSGGPLVADIARRPVLVGIVSWGSCAGGPAIYTRVAAFVPWIDATIKAAEARR